MGLLLGSRENYCVWSDLGNLCTIQLVIRALLAGGVRELSNTGGIQSVDWWSNIICLLARRGVFQGGSAHHVDVVSSRGSTRQVVAAYRYRGSTRHVVASCQGTKPSLWLSVGKFLPSPIQSVPISSERFFFLTDSPYSSGAHFDTAPPGAFGRNGSHGESA